MLESPIGTLQLTVTDYGAGASYVWTFGDASGATTGTNVTTHTYAEHGTYTVTVVVTTATGDVGQTSDCPVTAHCVTPDAPDIWYTLDQLVDSISQSVPHFEWHEPDDNGHAITSYSIYRRASNDPSTLPFPQPTDLFLSDIDPGTLIYEAGAGDQDLVVLSDGGYTYAVTATSACGEGDYSNHAFFVEPVPIAYGSGGGFNSNGEFGDQDRGLVNAIAQPHSVPDFTTVEMSGGGGYISIVSANGHVHTNVSHGSTGSDTVTYRIRDGQGRYSNVGTIAYFWAPS